MVQAKDESIIRVPTSMALRSSWAKSRQARGRQSHRDRRGPPGVTRRTPWTPHPRPPLRNRPRCLHRGIMSR